MTLDAHLRSCGFQETTDVDPLDLRMTVPGWNNFNIIARYRDKYSEDDFDMEFTPIEMHIRENLDLRMKHFFPKQIPTHLENYQKMSKIRKNIAYIQYVLGKNWEFR